MKIFRDFILKLFTFCMLILALVVILGVVDILSLNKLADVAITFLTSNSLVVICVSAVLAILALVGLLLNSDNGDEIRTGIAIKRETGNVYISKETFESIVVNVAKSFASLKNFKTSVNINDDGITANIVTYILPDTVVPTITTKLQEDIKDAILKQTTVELKEVNVKIKGVYTQVEKTTNA